MTQKRFSFLVHGQVQGVFFRDFTQKHATTYGLTGWVRNTSDGKVAGEVQGDEEGVQKLLKDVDDGPKHAKVVKLEKKEIDLKESERGFEVVS